MSTGGGANLLSTSEQVGRHRTAALTNHFRPLPGLSRARAVIPTRDHIMRLFPESSARVRDLNGSAAATASAAAAGALSGRVFSQAKNTGDQANSRLFHRADGMLCGKARPMSPALAPA